MTRALTLPQTLRVHAAVGATVELQMDPREARMLADALEGAHDRAARMIVDDHNIKWAIRDSRTDLEAQMRATRWEAAFWGLVCILVWLL